MRVPLGVIGIIYESRPNVTADAAGAVREVRQRLHPARRLRGAALQPGDRRPACARGCRRAGPARGRGAARRHRRPRRGGRADHDARVRRHHRAARRQGTDRAPRARVAHPDDQAPRRRLPRLHRRPRRPGDGGAHRRQRQDAALRHLQHDGDAAGGRGHRCQGAARIAAHLREQRRGDARPTMPRASSSAGRQGRDRGGLLHRVARAGRLDPRGDGPRRGDRAHRASTARSTPTPSSPRTRRARSASCARWTRAR